MLLLREKLSEQDRTQELSKLDKEALNKYRRQGRLTAAGGTLMSDKERQRSSTDMEKSTDDLHNDLDSVLGTFTDPNTALIVKCLKLMLNSRTATRARLLAEVRVVFCHVANCSVSQKGPTHFDRCQPIFVLFGRQATVHEICKQV